MQGFVYCDPARAIKKGTQGHHRCSLRELIMLLSSKAIGRPMIEAA